jgi:hypothetical protein
MDHINPKFYLDRAVWLLAYANAEAIDNAAIAIRIVAIEIRKKPATAANH